MIHESSDVAGAPRSILHRYVNEVRSFLRARSGLAPQPSALSDAQRGRCGPRSIELDELQAERRALPAEFGSFAELQQLLAAVAPADRLLIEQRLVLSMHWRDIALQRGAAGEDALERESARLRKRFQVLLRDLLVRPRPARLPVAAE